MIADRVIAWSLAFALAFFPTLASAQSPQVSAAVLGYHVPAVTAPGLPVLTFVGSVSGFTHSGAASTTTTANLGPTTGFTTRRIILSLHGALWTSLVSVTIGGVTATIHVTKNDPGNSNYTAICSADVPAGTSGQTIAVTYGSTVFGDPSVEVYTVDDALLSSTTPNVASANSTSTSSVTTGALTQSSGGFTVSVGRISGASGGGLAVTSPSGYVTSTGGGAAGDIAATLTTVVAGSATVTMGWTTALNSTFSVASWR